MTRRRRGTIIVLTIIAVAVWVWAISVNIAAAVERFASPTGVGTGTCISADCTVARALNQLQCGDTLTLRDGAYTGATGMLLADSSSTPSALVCSSGAPVVVQAQNDGAVSFDGQSTRSVCKFNGTVWWTVLGFDCHHGGATSGNNSTLDVVNAANFTMRRVVAWDASDGPADNLQVGIIRDSADVLIEDSAFFGLAVETFLDFGLNARVTYRRLWIRAEGSNAFPAAPGRGANPVQWNYTQEQHPTPALVENVIAVSCSNRGPCWYGTNWLRHTAQSPFVRVYGYIEYYNGLGLLRSGDVITSDGNYSGILLQDVMVHANGLARSPYGFGSGTNVEAVPPVRQLLATRITSVRGVASGYGSYTISPSGSNVEATTLAGTGFDYQGNNNTARLCFRYANGTYTSTPLWPWPMDARIKAAVAANSGNGSPALVGSAGTGYAAGTPTSEIVSLLGAIPPGCSSAGAPPPAPSGLTVN